MKRTAGEVFASNQPSHLHHAKINDHYSSRSKRMKLSDGGAESSRVRDYSDPFAISDLLASISSGKYGSVTKEIEALVARKVQLMNTLITMHPDIECKLPAARYNLGVEVSDVVDKKVADSENVVSMTVPSAAPVVIIDSDDEDIGDGQNLHHFREIYFPSPAVALLTDSVLVMSLGYLTLYYHLYHAFFQKLQ